MRAACVAVLLACGGALAPAPRREGLRGAPAPGDDRPASQSSGEFSAPAAARRRTVALAAAQRRGVVVRSAVVPDQAAATATAKFTEAREVEKSYTRCGEITKIFSKTFYFGTSFFEDAKKRAVWAIYVWCRRTDDIVDSPLATMLGPERMTDDLAKWEERLERIWVGEPTDSLDMALADAKKRYPALDIQPYKDMILGMLMDTPGHALFQARYATWEELEVYCYRVAGTVGLMTLPVLGTEAGCTLAEARDPALSLGIAFQITNILRDVGEDALRGRIYLPQADMDKFGVTEKQIMDGIVNENYVNLLKFEMDRAQKYYDHAAEGVLMLAPEAQLAVAVALEVYKEILNKIVLNNYDNFRKRAYVNKTEKFLLLPRAYMSIQKK
ncbi:isoprenoid synthase domain-containing protein [Pelagophyceae sp. CCMP2097]|nr:isoprenoid synthase domain-containing protein [Pelagophyceae sp. CCMP2097]